MATQTIKVEGLPEGWKAVAYRVPKGNIEFVLIENVVREAKPQDKKCLIVEKIQPREIRLVEITDKSQNIYRDKFINDKWWREVKETDIPLNSDEHKLSLNKKDMLDLIEHIKLGGRLHPKISEFIDYDQPEPKLSLSVDDAKELLNYLPSNTEFFKELIEFIKESS